MVTRSRGPAWGPVQNLASSTSLRKRAFDLQSFLPFLFRSTPASLIVVAKVEKCAHNHAGRNVKVIKTEVGEHGSGHIGTCDAFWLLGKGTLRLAVLHIPLHTASDESGPFSTRKPTAAARQACFRGLFTALSEYLLWSREGEPRLIFHDPGPVYCQKQFHHDFQVI